MLGQGTSLPKAEASNYGKWFLLQSDLLNTDSLMVCIKVLNTYSWKRVNLL